MKKFIVSTLAMFVLVSFGVVFAQTNVASHDLRARIPDLLMLRITDGSNSSVNSPAVAFNFVADAAGLTAYLNMYMGLGDPAVAVDLDPTSSNFDDIVVLSNRGAWVVNVSATAFAFVDNVLAGEVAAGLALSDITVDPTVTTATATGGLSSINDTFALSTVAQSIASGTRTQGWTSLGISGDNYRISINGDEAPGTYITTVTYTITAP